ncbi:TPA: toprim domain-containing protein [Providencia alcalifaciens]
MESNLNVLIKEKKLEIVEYVTTTLVPLIVGDYRMAISLDDAINAIENTFAGLDENDKFLENKLNIISFEMPFVLRCDRENKCGTVLIVKEIYPDIFDDWSAHYPKAQQAPNAAADAYLQHARGLDIASLKGLYSESSYHANGLGAATVKFALPEGAYWERIIDRPSRFDRKANFFSSYKGRWWTLPQQDLTQAKEIWLTEGIFDALSLIQNGIAAVSLMTCHNYPEVALNTLRAALGNNKKPLLVWALDNGAAGKRAMKKFVARSHDDGWKATIMIIIIKMSKNIFKVGPRWL